MTEQIFTPSTPGVLQWDDYNDNNNYTQRGYRFAFFGKSITLVLVVDDPNNQPAYYEVDGGAPVPITSLSSNTPVVITSLQDTWHDLNIVTPNGDYNRLFCDVANFAKITSDIGIPRIEFTDGYGIPVLPEDLDTADGAKVVQSATMQPVQDGPRKVFGTIAGIKDPNLFVRGNFGGFGVRVRTISTGDVAHFSVLKRRIGEYKATVVAETYFRCDGKVHTFSLSQAENEYAEWFLYHNAANGATLTNVCVAGATAENPLTPLALSGGLKKVCFGTGTSLMVSSLNVQACVNTSVLAFGLMVVSLGFLSANSGVGGSALRSQSSGGNDGSGFDGLSRIATVLPNVRGTIAAVFNCHCENDSTQTAKYALFKQDMIDVGLQVAANYPGALYLMMPFETPSANATNPTIFAAMVGTLAAPGLIRQAETAIAAQIGANRVKTIDLANTRAALAAHGDWSYDIPPLHQREREVPTMARTMTVSAAPAFGIIYSDAPVASLDSATIAAIAAKVERSGGSLEQLLTRVLLAIPNAAAGTDTGLARTTDLPVAVSAEDNADELLGREEIRRAIAATGALGGQRSETDDTITEQFNMPGGGTLRLHVDAQDQLEATVEA